MKPGRPVPPAARGAALGLAALAALVACGPAEVSAPADRASRYGIFRDLVWFPWRAGRPGGFFLDLFETSQKDWRAYRLARGEDPAATTAFLAAWADSGAVDLALPVVGVDLGEARRFARWRFGRLPRYEEWEFAATARGRYRLPWGNLPRTAWANSAELRYVRLTPVGMFESGRQAGAPYDLIGNAGEWTESFDLDWRAAEVGFGLGSRLAVLGADPAWQPWWRLGVPLPAFCIVMVDSASVARLIARGADRPMLGPAGLRPVEPEGRHPAERGSLLGLRVAADPAGIVQSLLAEPAPPDAAGEQVLRSFLRRHRAVMAPAWRARAEGASGPLAAILGDELGR